MKVLVLVVDRDDDLGAKAGIKTPVVGEEEAIKAAEALALSDPEDSDSNTIFAAVKAYRELKEKGKDVEIAIVSGHPSLGMIADSRIREQIGDIVEKEGVNGIVFVSDGAEDDQVIPIILSFAPIISKKTVIVKQAKELEKTYYVIKEALKDPVIARLFIGLPGILLFLWFVLGDLGLRVVGGVLGVYLILKGFGAEEPIVQGIKNVVSGITFRNISAPVYILSLSLFFMALYFSATTYAYFPDQDIHLYESLRVFISFSAIAGLAYMFGRMVDAHTFKKAYKIGKYLVYSASIIVFWAVFDVLLQILETKAFFQDLALTFVISMIFYIVVERFARIFEDSIKTSKKIIGLPVFTKKGDLLGRVEKVENGRIFISHGIELTPDRVHIEGGRLIAVI